MTGVALVTTTLGSAADAKAMAHALVEARLAACVQVMAVASVYRWQGVVEAADEHHLVCKIAVNDYAEVAAAIRARHPYDLPEIVMSELAAGDAGYLDWVRASTTGDRPPPQD